MACLCEPCDSNCFYVESVASQCRFLSMMGLCGLALEDDLPAASGGTVAKAVVVPEMPGVLRVSELEAPEMQPKGQSTGLFAIQVP